MAGRPDGHHCMLSWLELTAAGDEIFRRSKVGGAARKQGQSRVE